MKVVLNKKAQKQFERLDSVIKKRVAELFDELEYLAIHEARARH